MFVLDTNVVSELRKVRSGNADPNVIEWSSSIDASSFFVSVITVMELEMGILQIARRDPTQGSILRKWLEYSVLPAFKGRILNFDVAVARRCAKLHVPDRCSERDALIAATALVHGMTLATRNVADFSKTGVNLFNPWL